MNGLFVMDSGIRRLSGGPDLFGPACTVRVYPGDNLMVHKALYVAQPGDDLVIDGGGASQNGLVGGLIATKSRHRGISGIVIDGPARDLDEIEATGLAVYARGTTVRGPMQRGPGEINFPAVCGGLVVNPGDLIRGNSDGIVVVPKDFVDQLLSRLESVQGPIREYSEAVKRGEFSCDWVDRILSQEGCQFVEDEEA
jgi:regulator of RNase E activity RraA